ncbi:MAG TPA: DUF2490 domain-containing protein [Pyrinomonadaceae bacterium]
MKNLLLGLIFALYLPLSINAQTAQPEDDLQSWNDVQITVPMTKKVDFQTTFTARFGKNISRVNDSRFAIGFVLKPTKSLSFHPFFLRVDARNANSRFRPEHRLNLRAAYRFPTKKFGLLHRSLFEYRLRQPRNSFRYRPSITFEKAVPKNFIPKATFFVTEEVFYDSILKRFSRNRLSAGINKVFNKNLSLDLFYLRQNDGTTRPGDLHVIGTALRVKF